MKKKISFGKIAYQSKRKNNLVEIEINLNKNQKDVWCLSISGSIWNSKKTDWVSGGQIHDTLKTIPELKNNKLLQEICKIWEEYHLNDMQAGCEHQRSNPYFNKPYNEIEDKVCPECGYVYGSAWLTKEIPADVLKRIQEIIS
jgi:hypothetical protein